MPGILLLIGFRPNSTGQSIMETATRLGTNGPSGVVALADADPGYNLEQYGTDFDDADTLDPSTSESAPANCNTPDPNSTPVCQVVGDDYSDYYQDYFAGGTTSSPGCTLS